MANITVLTNTNSTATLDLAGEVIELAGFVSVTPTINKLLAKVYNPKRNASVIGIEGSVSPDEVEIVCTTLDRDVMKFLNDSFNNSTAGIPQEVVATFTDVATGTTIYKIIDADVKQRVVQTTIDDALESKFTIILSGKIE